jgi:hypothetical protein
MYCFDFWKEKVHLPKKKFFFNNYINIHEAIIDANQIIESNFTSENKDILNFLEDNISNNFEEEQILKIKNKLEKKKKKSIIKENEESIEEESIDNHSNHEYSSEFEEFGDEEEEESFDNQINSTQNSLKTKSKPKQKTSPKTTPKNKPKPKTKPSIKKVPTSVSLIPIKESNFGILKNTNIRRIDKIQVIFFEKIKS